MKRSICKTLSLGFAAGAIALCGASVQAQTATATDSATTSTTTTTTTTTEAMPSTTPMQVSGTVERYYVDRAGFVTAMDVKTAEGTRMIRFAPSMAQALTAAYPVGSTASVYVTSSMMMDSMMGSTMRYDLAGMGASMPTPTSMMAPMMVSDLDLLKSEPYTTIGAKPMRVEGMLTGYVADPMSGEVLALVLDNSTIVRVPRQNRLMPASMAPEGITPLMKGASVVAYGLPEAPRFGAVSPYMQRLIGTGISVNGRSLGRLGFGKVKMSKRDTLFGFNLAGGMKGTPEEMSAMQAGYMTYSTPGSSPDTTGATTAPAMGTTTPGM